MFLFVSIKYRSSSLGFSVASFVSARNVSYAEVHHHCYCRRHGPAIPKGNPGNGAVKKAEQKRCEKGFLSQICAVLLQGWHMCAVHLATINEGL